MSVSPPLEATIRALAATFTPSLQEDTAQLRRIYSNVCYVYGDLPSAADEVGAASACDRGPQLAPP